MTSPLETKLGYTFKNPELLQQALTHRSKGALHNERLEFLGDGVVNFVIGEMLYRQYENATEGDLSRWRASLVNRDALADIAKKFDLGQHLALGAGEVRSGGSERHSILSCAMEAVIGAVYLDGGYQTVYDCLASWYEELLQSLSSPASHKDSKTLLQEYVQKHRYALPLYTVESIEGEAHQQLFVVSCQIEGVSGKTLGRGTSRRRAEQEAAQGMLGVIRK